MTMTDFSNFTNDANAAIEQPVDHPIEAMEANEIGNSKTQNEMTAPTVMLESHLQSVEDELGHLLDDLSQLVTRSFLTQSEENEDKWDQELEGFRVKATTIRRILDRFHDADLPTRRYLRHHLDEEWTQLKSAYDSLRELFTSKDAPKRLHGMDSRNVAEIASPRNENDKGGRKWNG